MKRLTSFLVIFLILLQECGYAIPEDEKDYYIEDQIVGHVHKPYARREYNWLEANRTVIMRTNNLGFRKDTDTKAEKEKGTVRILITGDSQTDGVVNNCESFPNLLEKELNAGKGKFEVINGAVGYYGIDHYLFFLMKYSYLKPDMYIVTITIGNDFLDAARILEASGGVNKRTPDYFKTLGECKSDCEGVVDQALNQIYYFKNFPAMQSRVVRHSLDVLLEIKKYCKLHNIGLLIVFLPTKPDVEWQTDSQRLNKAKECLGLNDSDLQINQNLKDAVIKEFLKEKVTYFDLTNDMKAKHNEFYWKTDYHLNDQGHRFIARMFYVRYAYYFQEISKNVSKWLY